MGLAEASISGTYPNRKLNLKIPRGATGPVGPSGPIGDMVPVSGPVNSGAAIALAMNDFPSNRRITLTANATVTLPSPPAGRSGTITLDMTQGGAGGYTITWPATVKWPDGIKQQPAAAVGSRSIIMLQWTGVDWLGILGGKSFA